MAAHSKLKLSGSTNGLATLVARTSTLGTVIHAAHATSLDEIWLWAHNYDTTDRKLTIEFGGVAAKDTVEFTVPAEDGLYLVLPGLILTGSVSCTAFAATATAIGIVGYVNRIT
jgi:hypothetical protein